MSSRSSSTSTPSHCVSRRLSTFCLTTGKGFVAAIVCLLIASRFPTACAQRPYPLPGQDGPFPETNATSVLDINTTVLLERVTGLDEKENSYAAIWWVVLSWRDPSAAATVAAATTAFMAPNGSCNRPCDSAQMPSTGCCDGMWLPRIELPNMIYYDDDQQPRYRINANASSGVVTWSTRLVGKWHAPLDFRAYPFDHQHILMELALADSQSGRAALKWQHVAQLNNTAHTKGADFSGWRIKWGKGKVYDSRNCYKEHNIAEPWYLYPSNSSSSAANASATAENATYQSLTIADFHFADNRLHGTTLPPACGVWKDGYAEAQALYGPVVLITDFMLKRVSSYYVLTNLLPVLIITFTAFVVFFMPQHELGDRMSVVLTMFLSLTAMQFVFDFPPANYINALQMIVLVSYIMIAVTCFESLIVNRISTVADAVGIKRSCMRKYGTMLARGAFDRHLTRELIFATKPPNSIAGGGLKPFGIGSGGGKNFGASGSFGSNRPVFRSAAGAALAAKKAQMTERAAAGSTAGSGGGGGGGDHHTHAGATGRGNAHHNLSSARDAGEKGQAEMWQGSTQLGVREDSALEGEHLLSNSQMKPGPTNSSSPSELTFNPGTPATGNHPTATMRLPSPTAHITGAATPPPHHPAPTERARRLSAGAIVSSSPVGGAAPAVKRRLSSTDIEANDEGDVVNNLPIAGRAGATLTSPFASARSHFSFVSARSHVSFGVNSPPRGADEVRCVAPDVRSVGGADVRSVGSSRTSFTATFINGVGNTWRRCRALGCMGTVRVFFLALRAWMAAVAAAPGQYYRQCKEDPSFARFVAARIDKWCCIVSITLYIICVSILLYVQTLVGDHKLMLGDRPGNM